ncbi:hypothetical protein TNCV_2950561 [Trichonephila clavipes]|nr:hypothetical protein TNCV_2950561 [Trichonephila clavipes]
MRHRHLDEVQNYEKRRQQPHVALECDVNKKKLKPIQSLFPVAHTEIFQGDEGLKSILSCPNMLLKISHTEGTDAREICLVSSNVLPIVWCRC